MPQLDLLTFSIQISVMIFFGWGLFILLSYLILPQYFILNHSKKLFWFYLNNLIIKIKFFGLLSYIHLITALNFFSKGMLCKASRFKFLIKIFPKYRLKTLKLKKNIFSLIKIFFFKNIFLFNNSSIKKSLISIFGQKNKLNFFLKRNSTYSFVQKYLLNFYNKYFITKRKRIKIMLKEAAKFWALDDKIYLKNTANFSQKSISIFSLN